MSRAPLTTDGAEVSWSVASRRRRAINGTLHNFLGTLASRYSDYDGYWIFGFLVKKLSHSTLDLLHDESATVDRTPAWSAFANLARRRFAEQLHLNSVTTFVRRATLDVDRGRALSGAQNGAVSAGYELTLSVEIASDLGRLYRDRLSFFVAEHHPGIESRSRRRETAT